jgi:hypothetical protein
MNYSAAMSKASTYIRGVEVMFKNLGKETVQGEIQSSVPVKTSAI